MSVYNPKTRRSRGANKASPAKEQYRVARDAMNNKFGSYLLRLNSGKRIRVRNLKCKKCGKYFRAAAESVEEFKLKYCPGCQGREWKTWQRVRASYEKELHERWKKKGIKVTKLTPEELEAHLLSLKKKK